MRNRADEIRRRYKNVLHRGKPVKTEEIKNHSSNDDKQDLFGEDPYIDHPLFQAGGLLFRIMLSVCLFLGIGILLKNPSANMDSARAYVIQVFEQEFHFAKVSNWYEDQFGKPLTLLPVPSGNHETEDNGDQGTAVYALPAASRVMESFEDNGKGILIETSRQSVKAAKEGYVTFIGKKESLGNTVIIQHFDGSESWYGKLKSFDKELKLYSYIDAGSNVGSVSESESTDVGTFYFAIKKDNKFIDPLEVSNFK